MYEVTRSVTSKLQGTDGMSVYVELQKSQERTSLYYFLLFFFTLMNLTSCSKS